MDNEIVPITKTEHWDRAISPNNHKPEEIHIVEFINWKAYTICNVWIKGYWRTCSFPATTSVIEFLMKGSISQANNWSQGRNYTND